MIWLYDDLFNYLKLFWKCDHTFLQYKRPVLWKITRGRTWKVIQVINLGFFFNSKLDFFLYYTMVINRILKLQSLICKYSNDFHSVISFKISILSLHCSLVFDLLWNIFHQWKCWKCWKYIIKTLNIPSGIYLHQLNHVNILGNIWLLKSGYHAEWIIWFLYKIISVTYSVPSVLSSTGLRTPTTETRDTSLFALEFHRCNYDKFSQISRIVASGNKHDTDFFQFEVNAFKNKLRILNLWCLWYFMLYIFLIIVFLSNKLNSLATECFFHICIMNPNFVYVINFLK